MQMNPSSVILVTRSSMPPIEEYIKEIEPLWDSHWLTNEGPIHQLLQGKLERYLSVPHTELFVNGHSALEAAIEALSLQGEVITTPFSFASTTHAIVRKGLKPVFCDIRAEDFTIDPAKIESLITPRTSAIIPVHVYGNVCDVESIQHIADKYGLKVIYDAAHAFGVRYKGKGIASFGDVSMMSFHATKVFNTIEGGCVCFADASLQSRFRKIRNFGITSPETVESVEGNFKMNEFCAAMGVCNLRHVDSEIEKRKHVADEYAQSLADIDGVRIITNSNSNESDIVANYAYMPVLFDEEKCGVSRDDVYYALLRQGIHARKYFYPLINDYACYSKKFDSSLTPTAKWAADHVLCLPIYADLPIASVDRICSIALDLICKRK